MVATCAVAEVGGRVGDRTTALVELVVDGAFGAKEMCV
jgi:hypothetical protein